MAIIGDLFPRKHLVVALGRAFDPYLIGSPWAWSNVAIMAAWAVGASVLAVARFSWQPVAPRATRRRGRQPGSHPATVPDPRGGLPAGRPGSLGLVAEQVRYANRSTWRDFGSVFFAVTFPAILVVVVPAIFGTGEVTIGTRLRFPQWFVPAMAV